MSKAKSKGHEKAKGKDWTSKLQEVILSGQDSQHVVIPIKGGSDNGEFPIVGPKLKAYKVVYRSGKLHEGDVIVEVQGQKVPGYTQLDVNQWIAQVSKNGTPIMMKTVKQGLLTEDLREYLNARFPKGSEDHNLQQTIRDNLYLRTVPCTSRKPRPGEVNGVDYTFLSIEDFQALEASGELLESGEFEGNLYGTPRPPKEPLRSPPSVHGGSTLGSPSGLLDVPTVTGVDDDDDDPATPSRGEGKGQHPSSEGKRRRNRSNVEAVNPTDMPVGNDPSSDDPHRHPPDANEDRGPDERGPLPPNWEMATTPDGQVYFIDRNTDTTHWEDPRDQPNPGEANLEQLPYGWERVDDHRYGVYYIDHVNRRTQYEHPSLTCNAPDDEFGDLKREERLGSGISKKSNNTVSSGQSALQSDLGSFSGNSLLPVTGGEPIGPGITRSFFTRDPRDLRGEFLRTALTKGSRGFGFTIIGGDDEHEEFLQIKAVVPEGVADKDGKLATGDVIVYINGRCVLGWTHQDVVTLFQSMNIGDVVHIEVVRGYPMPYDPDDPNTEIVTTNAVDKDSAPAGGVSPLRPPSAGSHGQPPPPEIIVVNITKGTMGFGFTIADSIHGQKVKQILDRTRCQNLYEGDILIGINDFNVREIDHNSVVNALKDCPIGVPTTITVLRGGVAPPPFVKMNGRPRSNMENRSPLPSPAEDPRQPRHQLENQPSFPSSTGFPETTPHPPSQASSTSLPPHSSYNQPIHAPPHQGNPVEPPRTPRDPGPEPYSNTPGGQMPPQTLSHVADAPQYRSKTPTSTSSFNNEPHVPMLRSKTPNSLVDAKAAQLSLANLHKSVTPHFIPASAYTYNESPSINDTDKNLNKIIDLGGAHSHDLPPGVPQGSVQVLPSLPQNSQSPPQQLGEQPPPMYHTSQVFLKRQKSGFGFRIVGGTEEGSQVAIGYVVPGGVADVSNLLQTGDEITSVDGIDVMGASHHRVVQLMQNAAVNGRVNLGIRRPIAPPGSASTPSGMNPSAESIYPYDVTVERRENEGFGFVIVSSVAKSGLTIGRIIEASPAERCGMLHVGDRIIAVNFHPIDNMHHEEIIKQIKDSGYIVTLTIGAPQDQNDFGSAPAGTPELPQQQPQQPPLYGNPINGNRDQPAAVIEPQQHQQQQLHHQEPLPVASRQQFPSAQQDDNSYLSIDLHRGNRGFGFSIRGGQEFNMPLFVLRIAEDGAAKADGRLMVGDQIIEINGVTTHQMTHGQAIDIIKHGGQTVRLLIKRSSPFQNAPHPPTSSSVANGLPSHIQSNWSGNAGPAPGRQAPAPGSHLGNVHGQPGLSTPAMYQNQMAGFADAENESRSYGINSVPSIPSYG